MIKWGHAIMIVICAAALGGLIMSAFNQFGPTTDDMQSTSPWFVILSIAGGIVAGAIIWWLPWPFIEMLWHRQPNDRAIYLMIILNTVILAVAYYQLTQMTRLIYPEVGCIAAAAAIYYRNYTVRD